VNSPISGHWFHRPFFFFFQITSCEKEKKIDKAPWGYQGLESANRIKLHRMKVLHVMNRVLSSPTTAADDGKEHITEGTPGIALTFEVQKSFTYSIPQRSNPDLLSF